MLHASFLHPPENKGKLFPTGPILSGGLEDIVNFGASLGLIFDGGIERASAVTRASIAKGLVSPSRIEGWKEVGSGGILDPRKNPSGPEFEK